MKRMTQKQGLPLPPGEFHLLRRHPLLCGLFAFFINMQMQEAGVTYANAWGTVLYTAHLYNAVKQEGSTQSSWPDMQMLTHLQTPERLFVGGAPTNAQDYLKRFTLCMGYDAEQYARNRRTHTPVASKTGPRGLKELGEISQIFKKRYCENGDLHDWSLESVEQILNAKYKVSKSTGEPEKNGVMNIELQARNTKEAQEYARKKFRKIKKLEPSELLYALQIAISHEVPAISFDYFSFHMTCWLVLGAIRKVLHPDLLKYYGPGYLETESQLPWIVGYIFMVASGSFTAAKNLGLATPRGGSKISSVLLQKAGGGIDFLHDDDKFGSMMSQVAQEIALERIMFRRQGQNEIEVDAVIDFGDWEMQLQPSEATD